MTVTEILRQLSSKPLPVPAGSYRSQAGRELASMPFAVEKMAAGATYSGTPFKGIASAFGTKIDTWIPTVISPGAFTKTLVDNAARIKVLYQHDECNILCAPSVLRETNSGLYIEGTVLPTSLGKDVGILLNAEPPALTEMSIGFEPTVWEMSPLPGSADPDAFQRDIKELTLWEVSLVTFGANRDAKIMSLHSLAKLVDPSSQTADLIAGIPAAVSAELMTILGEFKAEDGDLVTFALLKLTERHAGKVLSSKNRALVSSALEALQKLIDAADAADADPADDQARAAADAEALAAATLAASARVARTARNHAERNLALADLERQTVGV